VEDLFEDREEGLKYGIMFSISVPLAFRTQGFATRAFLGTTTGALSPKQNVSYECTLFLRLRNGMLSHWDFIVFEKNKNHLRYYFFFPVYSFLDNKNPFMCFNAYKVLYFKYCVSLSFRYTYFIFFTFGSTKLIWIYSALMDLKVRIVNIYWIIIMMN